MWAWESSPHKVWWGRLANGIEQKEARGQVNDIRLSPSSLLLMEAGVFRGAKGLPSAGSHCASHILSGTLLRWLSPEMLGQQRVAKESKAQTGKENGVDAAYCADTCQNNPKE